MFHPCNYIVPVITPPVFLLSPQWVRRLVAGLSVRRPGFDPRPLGFVVDRVALDRFFAKYLYFSLSVSFHQSCTLPCQYHFTKAALSPVSIIPPKLHSPLSVSFHQSCTLPCQYHFTKAALSPVSIISPKLHTHFRLHIALTRRTSVRSLETFLNTMLFRKSGNFGYEVPSLNV